MRARFAAPLLALVLAAGCGGGPAKTQVVPSTPAGTVWGQVVDGGGQTPLAGVKVSLAISGAAKTTKTGTDGSFRFTGVPAGGQAAVTLSMSGYDTATLPFTIPATTGNFPADGIGAYIGPIALFPSTGVAHVQVIGYDGSMIDKAHVTVSIRAAYEDLGTSRTLGAASVSGQTSSGEVDIKGLPNPTSVAAYTSIPYIVTVAPVDTSGNGIPDYLGTSIAVPPSALAMDAGRVTVTLPAPGANTPLEPIASNVGSIFSGGFARYGNSLLAPSDPVRVIFNQPVDGGTIVAHIRDDTNKLLAISVAVKQGNVVEITPHQAFVAGGAYFVDLQVRAAGTISGVYRAGADGWFYVLQGNTQPSVASYSFNNVNGDQFLDAGDMVTVTLDRAVGGDGASKYPIAFYIKTDLDNSGTIGDGFGEAGSGQPIELYPVEPNPMIGPPPGPGLVRTYQGYLPNIAPKSGSPYQFGTGTSFAYILDFPNSTGVRDAAGQPLQQTQGQFKVSFAPAP